MLAYIQYVSTGVPMGKVIEGRGSAPLPLLSRAANPQKGAAIYKKICIACHQADGQGKRPIVVTAVSARDKAKDLHWPILDVFREACNQVSCHLLWTARRIRAAINSSRGRRRSV